MKLRSTVIFQHFFVCRRQPFPTPPRGRRYLVLQVLALSERYGGDVFDCLAPRARRLHELRGAARDLIEQDKARWRRQAARRCGVANQTSNVGDVA